MSERSNAQPVEPVEPVEAAQLRLLPGGERRHDWHLDERTRRVGRRGVAAAREVLRQAHPPQPMAPGEARKAS